MKAGIATLRRAMTQESTATFSAAIAHLRKGGVLIYPTETSYAIGCDATNAHAVASIFRMKGRASEQSLPLIVASRAMAERYATFTLLARRLTARHWPGPLTVVLTVRARRFSPPPKRGGARGGWRPLARGIIARDHTIALRLSAHPIARTLSRRLGKPIVSTSANRSGHPPARSAIAARRAFPQSSILILDSGASRPRRPSTIVDARTRHAIVLRKGAIIL